MADPIKSRINQILSEKLDMEKTKQNMGAKIEARLKSDSSAVAAKVDVDTFLNRVMEVDPTPNDKYWQWIVRAYLNKGIRLYEDLYKVTAPLTLFHKFKKKMPQPDINKIGNLNALMDMVEPFEAATSGKEEKKNERKELVDSGEAVVLMNNDRYSVVIPKTEKASCVFGKGTRWCTNSTDGNNMFDHYAKDGDLYIITDKKDVDEKGHQKRWQFHFESEQFMDVNDEPINLYDFFSTHGDILKNVAIFDERFKFTEEGYCLRIPIK